MARIPELHPDFPADDERVFTSICQFDILANLAVIDEVGEAHPGILYPDFKRFYSNRTDPAVVTLLEDQDARRALFNRNDEELARALRALGEMGSGEFFFIGGWDGYQDQRILELLQQNPPPGPQPG